MVRWAKQAPVRSHVRDFAQERKPHSAIREVLLAFETLSDASERAKYDRYIERKPAREPCKRSTDAGSSGGGRQPGSSCLSRSAQEKRRHAGESVKPGAARSSGGSRRCDVAGLERLKTCTGKLRLYFEGLGSGGSDA